MTEIHRHFEFMSLRCNVKFYEDFNRKPKATFISEGLSMRELEVNKTLQEILPAYEETVFENMQMLGIRNAEKSAQIYLEKQLYKNPILFTYDYLNFKTVNLEAFYKSSSLVNLINSDKGFIINAFHTDLFQTIPFLMTSVLKSLKSNKKIYIVGPEQSLSVLREVDNEVHGGINQIDYLYIDDLDDQPYPLLLKNCIKVLENGDVLYILPEISFGFNTTHTTEFFDIEVKLPMGSAYLSQKLKVPIIFMYSIVDDKSNENLIFVTEPNFPSDYEGTAKENIYEQSKDIFSQLERVVTHYPTSWIGFESFGYMRKSNE